MHICIHGTHAHIYTYIMAYTQSLAHMHIHVHLGIHSHICTCTYARIHTNTHAHNSKSVRMQLCAHCFHKQIHAFYTFMHTYRQYKTYEWCTLKVIYVTVTSTQ